MSGISVDQATISGSFVDDSQRCNRLRGLLRALVEVRAQLEAIDICAQTVSSLLEHPEIATDEEKLILLLLEQAAGSTQKRLNDLMKKIPKTQRRSLQR